METEKFARQCDFTGEGMNEGYVFNGGQFYAKDEETAKKYVEDCLNLNWEEELQTVNTDEEWFYWTEWEEEDYEWEVIDGVLTEIEN